MPRPKPPEPYVNIALRLPPLLADKVRGFAASHGFTVSGAIRHMIEFHEEIPHEEVGRIMQQIGPTFVVPKDVKAFNVEVGPGKLRVTAVDAITGEPVNRPRASPKKPKGGK